MKINIIDIYKKNIEEVYNDLNKEKYQKDFTAKEREMWQFTLELGKDNFPKQTYDSILDRKYLSEYLDLYLSNSQTIQFSIDEWFKFLSSKK